jgi:hypothetical protein
MKKLIITTILLLSIGAGFNPRKKTDLGFSPIITHTFGIGIPGEEGFSEPYLYGSDMWIFWDYPGSLESITDNWFMVERKIDGGPWIVVATYLEFGEFYDDLSGIRDRSWLTYRVSVKVGRFPRHYSDPVSFQHIKNL